MSDESLEERVLIWAPKGRDAALVRQLLLRNGLLGVPVSGIEEFCHELEQPTGCAVTTEDELTPKVRQFLSEVLARQPPWSDFPLIILGPEMAREANHLPVEFGNVTTLDRPVSARSLLGAVRQALRSRRRQYEGRRAIRQRDQFLAMLGHELRNPLGAIVFATELLDRVGADTEVGSRHRRTIRRQTRHLSRLVDDLLDAARLTSGKLVLQRRQVEVSEILDRSVQSMESLAQASRVELNKGQVVPCWVNGDPVRLEQVLGNLLTNALKYTAPDSAVTVSIEPVAGQCEIRVRDQGLGIATDRLEKIFELFEQSDETLDRSRGGLGIGLTLVKSLVELHEGTVEAHSEGVGAGSEFIVRLPLAEPPAPAVERTVRPKIAVPAGVEVVLVEDNADILEASKEFLEMLGCRVQIAADGPAGLTRILEVQPDLALVDVGLPGMNGYEVAQAVRRAGVTRVRLVAMTGYGQAEDRQRALASGFDLHLTKPVTFEVLEALVSGAVEPRALAIRHA